LNGHEITNKIVLNIYFLTKYNFRISGYLNCAIHDFQTTKTKQYLNKWTVVLFSEPGIHAKTCTLYIVDKILTIHKTKRNDQPDRNMKAIDALSNFTFK
jgi:peroxiredoxin